MEGITGAINGEYGELDWMPVRYIHRSTARAGCRAVPCVQRGAGDAAARRHEPGRQGIHRRAGPGRSGVLVLSRFAGAAEQMKEALLVNPYDTRATAQAIQQALHMPLSERQARHQKLLERIRQQDVHWWSGEYLRALMETEGG
jgi:trehalose 6-phosphate synthase